jgi:N-glycosylase/DNA lyase
MTSQVKQQEKQTNVVRAYRGLVAEQQTCRIEVKKRGSRIKRGRETAGKTTETNGGGSAGEAG